MPDGLPAMSAALLAGLLGSAHCLGMCAGISGLVAVNAGAAAMRQQLSYALIYNIGRIVSYAALGTIVASLGSVALKASPGVASGVRLLSGVIIVLVGLKVAFDLRWLNAVEKSGAVLWSKIAPIARSLVPVTTLPRALGLGLLWGWLPCGLVYSALLVAATSVEPATGAMIMSAFGIGTLPAMIATGLGAARLSLWMRQRGTRVGLGLLIVVLGLLTVAMPISQRFAHLH